MYTPGPVFRCAARTVSARVCVCAAVCVSGYRLWATFFFLPPVKALALLYTLDCRARARRERAGGRGVTSPDTRQRNTLYLCFVLILYV